MNQNNYNLNWKQILGFRNMQEKLENIYVISFSASQRFLEKYIRLDP